MQQLGATRCHDDVPVAVAAGQRARTLALPRAGNCIVGGRRPAGKRYGVPPSYVSGQHGGATPDDNTALQDHAICNDAAFVVAQTTG
eukprot:11202503-Lingulodinium_polyedra.AAC.1